MVNQIRRPKIAPKDLRTITGNARPHGASFTDVLLRLRAPSRFVTGATFSARRREVGGAGAVTRALVIDSSVCYVKGSLLGGEPIDKQLELRVQFRRDRRLHA